MIVQEHFDIEGREFIHTYSDANRFVVRDGMEYSEACDPAEFGRTYTEGEMIPVEELDMEGWEPDKTPALWTEVAKPGEIPVWKQLTGTQDAYNKGDKVHYPDADCPVYESMIDNNVWSTDAYPAGWKEIT